MGKIRCPLSDVLIRDPMCFDNQEARFLTDFEELEPLGEGGYGTVVRCKCNLDGGIYAVKRVKIGENGLPYETVRREPRAMHCLCHDNVVRYYASWVEPKLFSPSKVISYPTLYIQQQFCPSTLEKLLKERTLSEKECWDFYEQILLGLQHIHSNNIMHGDISPSNMFLFEGKIKLGDFGHARFIGEDDGIIKKNEGNMFYKPPDKEVSSKVDIYSSGLVFFEMLNGNMDPNKKITSLFSVRTGQFPQSWTNGFVKSFLMALLDKNPLNRPSAAQVLAQFPYPFR